MMISIRASMGLYLAMSTTGVTGAYFSQLYPTRVRALGTSFVFNFGRGCSALAPFLIGSPASVYGLGKTLSFCTIPAVVTIIMIVILPETKKASVHEKKKAEAARSE
jgi:hypothetical protein